MQQRARVGGLCRYELGCSGCLVGQVGANGVDATHHSFERRLPYPVSRYLRQSGIVLTRFVPGYFHPPAESFGNAFAIQPSGEIVVADLIRPRRR